MFGIDDAVLVGAGSSLLGGLFGKSGASSANEMNALIARESNEFNAQQASIARGWASNEGIESRSWSAEQAAKQMDFQERMANTQWQRGVQDMQAAGLNPMLAYSRGGAAAPGGAMGSTSVPGGAHASAVSPPRFENANLAGLHSASEAMRTANETMRLRQEMKIKEPLEKLGDTASKGIDAVKEVVKPLSEKASEVVQAIEDKIKDSSISNVSPKLEKLLETARVIGRQAGEAVANPVKEVSKSTSSAIQGAKRALDANFDFQRRMIHGDKGTSPPPSKGKIPRDVQQRAREGRQGVYKWDVK